MEMSRHARFQEGSKSEELSLEMTYEEEEQEAVDVIVAVPREDRVEKEGREDEDDSKVYEEMGRVRGRLRIVAIGWRGRPRKEFQIARAGEEEAWVIEEEQAPFLAEVSMMEAMSSSEAGELACVLSGVVTLSHKIPGNKGHIDVKWSGVHGRLRSVDRAHIIARTPNGIGCADRRSDYYNL